jgi:hypothetical protein
VITLTLRVTDGLGRADLTPDPVVITVRNQAPISDAGPDRTEIIGSSVTLNGAASSDPDGDLPLKFLWTQIGGESVTLTDPTAVSPTFSAPSTPSVLTFALNVTDARSQADPTPDQVVITVRDLHRLFFPSVVSRYAIAPDLVVGSLTATATNVELEIQNQGLAPVANAFWVDVYINPSRAPAAVNETFDTLGTYGLAWGVYGEALSALTPGGSVTLRMGDAYYYPDISVFPAVLSRGTPVYAQVDSFNPDTGYGTVLESHEATGGPYNNIAGPVFSVTGVASGSTWVPHTHARPASVKNLPRRP